jgi:uncharacterized protein (DUF433 family)
MNASQIVLSGPGGKALIRKTTDVCGGDACVGDTRIMVWLLVAMKQRGLSDQEILAGYPTLTSADLEAAWEYYRLHPKELEDAIANQEKDE